MSLCEHGNIYSHCATCNPVEVEIVEDKKVIPIDQPKPKFTLLDLDQKLTYIYNMAMGALKNMPQDDSLESRICLKAATGSIQELVAIVDKCKQDLEPIDMPMNISEELLKVAEVEKIQFHVVGVQLIEDKRVSGVALYSTVAKARKSRDVLNAKFAELKTKKYEARILNYPVY